MGVVAELGWRLIDARLLCPPCVAAVGCACGHEFTVWYRARRCGCTRGPDGHAGGAGGCGLEFRYCTGCGREESHRVDTDLSVVA